MDTRPTVPQAVATAQQEAKRAEARIAELRAEIAGQEPSAAQADALRAETRPLEAAAVDIFTLFEARMQHHFKRGPFSKKLRGLLVDAGQADLAQRVQTYYWAVNVLKHGKGASYRALLESATPLVVLHGATNPEGTDAPESLIDVSMPGFFDGLAQTVLEAHQFLEKRGGPQ